MKWLKRGFVRKEQLRVTSAYKKVFASEDGQIILEDLALQAFGYTLTADTSNEKLREIAGKQILIKHILHQLRSEK